MRGGCAEVENSNISLGLLQNRPKGAYFDYLVSKDTKSDILPIDPFVVILHLTFEAFTNSNMCGFIIGSPRLPLKLMLVTFGNLVNTFVNDSKERCCSGNKLVKFTPCAFLGHPGHLALQYVDASTCR